MKRSEMVEIIKKEMEPWTNGVADEGEQIRAANHLLTKLEKAGMLPPTFVFYATGDVIPAKEAEDLICDSYDGRFEWKDEE